MSNIEDLGAARMEINVEEPTILTQDLLRVLSGVGVTEDFVGKLIRHRVVIPRTQGNKALRYWNGSDIFKVFCAKTMMAAEGGINPKRLHSAEIFQSVARRIGITMVRGYESFTSMPEWGEVCTAARERGIEFNSTKFRYTPL